MRRDSRTRRLRLAPAFLWVLLPVLAPAPAHSQSVASADQVKAAYIYNFANFAVWPAQAFEGTRSRFRLCIEGDLTIAPDLERTFRGEAVSGHPVTVVRNPPADEHRRCHILYVSGTARPVATVLKGVAGAPVLTIGDGEDFLARGGMLALVLDARHMRFDVNLRAATAAGVTLSARLLQVARQVQQ